MPFCLLSYNNNNNNNNNTGGISEVIVAVIAAETFDLVQSTVQQIPN
jgi:hypothetical protein